MKTGKLRLTRKDLKVEGEGVEAATVTAAVARAHSSGLPACVDVMIEGLAAPIVRQ